MTAGTDRTPGRPVARNEEAAGDYTVDRLPEASVVAGRGGRTVVVPYLPGRSTTRILAHRT